MTKSPESLSDGHYTAIEEQEILTAWGNSLMQSSPEIAIDLVKIMVEATTKPKPA